MKTIIAATAVTLFATSVSAADIYKDMGDGNPDLIPHRLASADVAAVQPSVGSGIDRYHGFGDGNPDVFSSSDRGAGRDATTSTKDSVTYVGPGRTF